MAMNFDELNKLSPKVKILVVVLACVLIGYFYYTLFLSDLLTQKMDLGTKLAELQRQVADKELAASQLSKHLQEVNALKEAFATALQKLPNEREIAGLLSSVVLSGKEAGVNFLLFEPKPPEKKTPETKPVKPPAAPPAPAATPAGGQPPKPAGPEKFYEDIPIKVQLTGGFHSTLSFFEQVARLPRIVNVEDITMAESQDVKGRGRIVKTSCTVKTYMFVEKKK